MAKGKALQKNKAGGVPAVHDYGDDQGAGFEGTTNADLSIPFLAILQVNSPQVEEKDPEGAEAGMLYNTVTRDLVDGGEGLPFIPCHKDHAYVEWVQRDKGGGFVGMHPANSKEVADAIARNDGSRMGKLVSGAGNELIETHYVYGLLLDEAGQETTGFAVVSFTSTKIKPCRDWFTALYTMKGRPPLFANRARLATVRQKNEKGTFYNFRIAPFDGNWISSLIPPDKGAALLAEAKEFREMVQSGMAKAAFETQDAAGKPEGDSDSGVPF